MAALGDGEGEGFEDGVGGVGGVGECEVLEGYGAGVGEAEGAGVFVGGAEGELVEAEERGGCCAGGGDLRD